MNYKDYLKQIKSALMLHKAEVDSYIKKESDFQKALQQKSVDMRKENKYSDSYIDESINIMKQEHIEATKRNAKATISAHQKKQRDFCNFQLAQLEKSIEKYFCSHISPRIMDLLNGYKMQECVLSKGEIEMLRKQVHTYPEMKMLNTFIKNQLKNGSLADVTEVESLCVELPTPDDILTAFNNYKTAVNMMLDSYCGTNAELYDILDIQEDKAQAVNVDSFFRGETENIFADLMDSANSIIPQVKQELNETELNYLDALFGSRMGYQLKEEVPKICKYQPELKELVRLSKYKDYLQEVSHEYP